MKMKWSKDMNFQAGNDQHNYKNENKVYEKVFSNRGSMFMCFFDFLRQAGSANIAA
jgi:hypothetical protein